jgi:hypothetical protein
VSAPLHDAHKSHLIWLQAKQNSGGAEAIVVAFL